MVLHVALATLYATYVVTRSEFPLVARLRDRVFDRWGEGSWQAYLATCAWCTAFYTSAALTAGTAASVGVTVPVLVWLGSAAVSGLVLEVVDTLQHVRSR